MKKTVMDKVFDVISEENRRFARLQADDRRTSVASRGKPDSEARGLAEAQRTLEDAKDCKLPFPI